MFRGFLGLSSVVALFLIACGGSVADISETHPGSAGGAAGGISLKGGANLFGGATHFGGQGGNSAGSGAHLPGGNISEGGHPTFAGHPNQGGNTTMQGGDGDGGLNMFHDPGCPDPGPPTEDYECDPNGPADQCGDGEGCSPFVDYPDSPCDKETYGAICQSVGPGQQGDPCDDGCAAKNICVVTGEGTQCVQICDLNAASPCPDGLICGTVDIPGVGGCI